MSLRRLLVSFATAAVAATVTVLPAAARHAAPTVSDIDMGAVAGGEREESIAVDPANPDHLAGGANDRGSGSTQRWYVSTDGGRNWTNGVLPNGTLTVPGTTTTLMSDPSLDFGSNGEIYYSALMHGGTGEPCTLFVSESGDDGANWTDPNNGIVAAGSTSPTVCQDKEHIVVDRANNDNVYVAWTPVGGGNDGNVVFSRDLNGVSGGFAFSAPATLSTGSCFDQGADFALSGNTMYVAWTSFCSGLADNAAATVNVVRSNNQGGSWSAPVAAATLNNVDFTSAGYRSRSHPSIDIDPTTGRVFVVYATYAGSGSDAEVMVASSLDGVTWTAPARVNQDTGTTDQWMPWIDVANGFVNVDFYTTGDSGGINAHLSYGAVAATPTFTDIRVSAASTPTTTGFLGDYNGIIVGSDDVAHPSWADGRTSLGGNATDVYTARVNFSPATTLDVQPPSQNKEVGQTATVAAHVTGSHGEDETFIPVSFTVTSSGSPSPSSGSGVTGSDGKKSFSYSNTVSGTDTVHVFADLNENGTEQSGEGANVTVTWTPGPPASLTLAPPTATNTVDSTHTVTATVKDQYGNLVNPVVVRFKVTGANGVFGEPTSASSTTVNGQASFSYIGRMPGNDTITAFADYNNDGVRDPNPAGHEPQDTAAKTWTLPASTAGKFTGGGVIPRPGGATANFGFNFSGPSPSGNFNYQDKAPPGRHVKSLTVDAYVQTGSTGEIFGTATVNGGGSFVFRLDVKDNGEPGKNDTFRLRMSDGYDTGLKTLKSGNLQAH